MLTCSSGTMAGSGYAFYNTLFLIKIVLLLMFFACLLVIMVRMRVMIKILSEIRDKK